MITFLVVLLIQSVAFCEDALIIEPSGLISGNNMKISFDETKPLPTLITIVSKELHLESENQFVDMYFMFSFNSTHSKNFRPIHPSNPSLSITINGFKEDIFEELYDENKQEYSFILKTKYMSYRGGYCDIKFEGAYARANGILVTTVFSTNLEYVRKKQNCQIFEYEIAYSQNLVLRNGELIRYSLDCLDQNGQATSIYQNVTTVIPTIYYHLKGIKDIPGYSMFIYSISTNTVKGQFDDFWFNLYLQGPSTISDGKWAFTMKAKGGRNWMQVMNVTDVLYLYDDYTMALQFNSLIYHMYGLGTNGFGMKLEICKEFQKDCLHRDPDYFYFPEVQYVGYSQQLFSAKLLSSSELGLSSPFEFFVEISKTILTESIIVSINFPKELADINQGSYLHVTSNSFIQKLMRVENDRFPLPSEYTVSFLMIQFAYVNDPIQFKITLRAPNKSFVTNKLKMFISGVGNNLERSLIQEIQTDIQLKFIPKELPKFEILPKWSGIKTQSYYTFIIGLGYQINYDTYITIVVPPEVKVRDMPNTQNKNFPSDLDPYCSPFVQIENQKITITKLICPQYKIGIVKDKPLPLQVNSLFINPTTSVTLNFIIDVYQKNAEYLEQYNDNTYYHIHTQTLPFLYEFTTLATASCLNKVTLKGQVCDKLLVTLTTNSGILSSEEIVLTIPPEIIPPPDFLDEQNIPLVNNLRCQLLSGYLPTSSCQIDINTFKIVITDTQFSNNIYQMEKSIMIYNSIIPRYQNPLNTEIPPFPNNVTPFTYVVQAIDTKIISSSRQIIKKESFYKEIPLNSFLNLEVSQSCDTLNYSTNTIFVSFQIQVQVVSGDLIHILFPNFYDFTTSSLTLIGSVVKNLQYSFKPHPTYTAVTILEITVDKTINEFSVKNSIIIKNVKNTAQMPDYANSPVVQDYSQLKDSLLQIIDKTSSKPFYQSVVKNCFILSDTESMKIEALSLITRGRDSPYAIYGEDLSLRLVISISRLKNENKQKILDLFLSIPVLDQSTSNSLKVLINGEVHSDFEMTGNQDYANILRFKSFPYRASAEKQFYTLELLNVKSKKDIFSDPKDLNIKVQRMLMVSQDQTFELDKVEKSSSVSLKCDPNCYKCTTISTFCTECYPDKELHPLIPGKCRATIASKMLSIDVLPSTSNPLQDYNSITENVLNVSKSGDIFVQFQAYFAEISNYYLEVQVPSIFSTFESMELSYGEDITVDSQSKIIKNEQKFEFLSQKTPLGDKLLIRSKYPIELQFTRNHIIKISQIKLPNTSLNENNIDISLLIKDNLDPAQIRSQNTLQEKITVECGSVCKTCEERDTRCTSCFDGDEFDPLGYLCISRTCWQGQVKIKTIDGFVCVDDDGTQTCQIPYCLYCDTKLDNPYPKCKKCLIGFNLSARQDRCLFKDPNTKDDVQINNDEIPFGGQTTEPQEKDLLAKKIKNEMDIRELWAKEPQPIIPPEVKLYAPVGIMVTGGIVIYSIFNSLTQSNSSIFIDINDKLGFIDIAMSIYYGQRLMAIPQFDWWFFTQIVVIFAKTILQMVASYFILKFYGGELSSISWNKVNLIRLISFRHFYKVCQEQKKMYDLKYKKLKLGNKNKDNSNQAYLNLDEHNRILEQTSIIDEDNPSCVKLEFLNVLFIASLVINFSCIACYLYSRIVFSELYSASFEFRTLFFEYLVYKTVVLCSDISIIFKNIVIIGLYLNETQPYEFNFKKTTFVQDDSMLNVLGDNKNQEQVSNIQDEIDSKENESKLSASSQFDSSQTSTDSQQIQRCNSWPNEQQISHTGIEKIGFDSLDHNGFRKQTLDLNSGDSNGSDHKKNEIHYNDHEESKEQNKNKGISQFNIEQFQQD